MKRVKRIAAWAIWAGVWVGLGLSGCSPKGFERNPNLKELKGTSDDDYYPFSPIWADNGKVYYLASYSNYPFPECSAQAFRSIRADGTGDTLLLGDTAYLPGSFRLLAYHKPTGRIAILQVEGPILIWDTWTDSIVDSVPNHQHLGPFIRWCPDGTALLVGDESIWKVSIGDSVYSFYSSGSECGFEVNSDGSLYTELPWPSFCPIDSSTLAFSECIPLVENLFLRTPAGDTRLDANPWEYTAFYLFVSWSPDCEAIVFSAYMSRGEPAPPFWPELWILEDVR